MSKRTHIFLGISGALIGILAVAIAVGYWLVYRSHPVVEGEVLLSGLTEPVQVRRTEFGYVHIKAAHREDLYRAVGYVHAQDRLWQMELIRRVGEGRLAEVLGKDALAVDRLFRTLGLFRVAAEIEEAMDDRTRAALEQYAEGVNAGMVAFKGRLPIEFDMLGYEPESWTVRHSLLVSRLMAWELDYSRWMDILLSVFVARFGPERARVLFPSWLEGDPTIVGRLARDAEDGLMSYLAAETSARAVLGQSGLGHGSNAWAVHGSRTVTGKPYLANDPHLLLMAPGRFHEMHLVAPGLDVAGVMIPGVPFTIIGRNRSIAWGLTNAMIDDHDFFIEQVDNPSTPTRYMLDGRWVPMQQRVDTILVKDSDPVLLSVYSTHRGPIINRVEPSARWSSSLISMRWTGHDVTQDARAFLLLNEAQSWGEFTDALRYFAVPSQSFVYADTAGNIGYRTGGKVPIRDAAHALLPADGRSSSNDWRGFVPFEAMPASYNPEAGFVATANNAIAGTPYPYHLSHLLEPPWRAQRINEVLKDVGRATMEDMERLQQDVLSPLAREIVPLLVGVLSDSSADEPFPQYVSYLRTWDFRMDKGKVAPSIFESLYNHAMHETFIDEMGTELLALYDTLAGMPLTAFRRLLNDPDSDWFDDLRTPEREFRDDIIRRAFRLSLSDLQGRLGTDVRQWRWERLHTLTFSHVLGAVPALAPIFNVGPFAVGGSHSTVNVGYFLLDGSYTMTVGSSVRQIFDLADPNNTRTVMPPGQSGHVFHDNYDDQIQLWLNGSYKIVLMDSMSVARQAPMQLMLLPG